jgi:hypothetical protein
MLITPEETSNLSPVLAIHSTMLSDWLPKLGPQAFLAWLQFHDWKDSGQDPQQPFVVPLPLTQLIKRLKVGNSTFYDKILRPLWNYGLINLQYAKKGGHHIRLIVYTAPLNQPEKADKPLELLRFYDEDLTLSSFLPKTESIPGTPTTSHLRNESIRKKENRPPQIKTSRLEIEPIPLPNGRVPLSGNNPDTKTPVTLPIQDGDQNSFPIQENPPAFSNLDYLRSKEDVKKKKEKEMDQDLPEEIHSALLQNKDLQERLPQIMKVYHALKDHPRYTPASFRDKLESCIRYSHQKPAFGAYLHKSLLNEWNKKQPKSTDLPEWVITQTERYDPSNHSQNNQLTPEQQAEINRLLKALEEVKP